MEKLVMLYTTLIYCSWHALTCVTSNPSLTNIMKNFDTTAIMQYDHVLCQDGLIKDGVLPGPWCRRGGDDAGPQCLQGQAWDNAGLVAVIGSVKVWDGRQAKGQGASDVTNTYRGHYIRCGLHHIMMWIASHNDVD